MKRPRTSQNEVEIASNFTSNSFKIEDAKAAVLEFENLQLKEQIATITLKH